ncbi:PQQ-dependent sugar dehydrogenase, partial [Salmonella enterica]|uniref:PQQ-dependent sugar dehydrogenase n=1 Tax=Salmonella enterica TaxID=28901 RepID=UPI003FA6AF92
FYTGSRFPEWTNNAMFGAIASEQGVWRVQLSGNAEVTREHLSLSGTGVDLDTERVRAVRQGPDGWIYVLTDSGKLVKIDR